MSKFVLTAQLKLQSPKNTRQVISDLRKQLSGINIPVEVKGAAQAKRQVDQVTRSVKEASSQAQNMGKSFGLAFKRFAAFTVASRAVSLFTNTLANAVEEAIDFQREMVKISQVTGKTMKDLQGLERTIFNLSKTLGVNSKELLSTTRILSQAGIKAKELDVALEALAKTTLAPTFENINETAEGAIAILAQFKQGVGALENQLGSINAVAGQFAVESGDLIGAVRRTGGVFKEAGGTLEEFLGIFTSVRATTRESSESISTGLRTIFTRIQRPKTIEFLRQYGVELQDLDGKFVGPFEAIKRLNEALSGLGERDIRFVKIAEELGGFRQIGKVIPLLKEFELAERARQAAVDGGNSLTEDAAKAQIALATQIAKVKAEFAELIQSISNTGTFQALVKTSLDLASALIKVADAVKPLIPLITVFAGIKLAKGLGNFAAGFGGAIRGAASLDPKRKAQGGKILAFNRGGVVPGTGNRDTVPAMLQPGEFVIRKSSVNKIGTDKLAAMNAKGYAKGGMVVQLKNNALGGFYLRPQQGSEGSISTDIEPGGTKTSTSNITNVSAVKALARKGGLSESPFVTGAGTGLQGFGQLGKAGGANAQAEAMANLRLSKDDFNVKKRGRYAHLNPPGFNNPMGGASKSRLVDNDGNPSESLITNLKKAGSIGKENSRYADEAAVKKELEGILGKSSGTETANVPLKLAGSVATMTFGDRADSSFTADVEKSIKDKARSNLENTIDSVLGEGAVAKYLKAKDLGPITIDSSTAEASIRENLIGNEKKETSAIQTISGYIQEGMVAALTGAEVAGGDTSFDFPDVSSVGAQMKKFYGDIIATGSADAKPKADEPTAKAILKKYNNDLNKGIVRDQGYIAGVTAFAKGGGVSDTVPALLTPGEFVLNKRAAQKIGDSNLDAMNKSGRVQGFAKGGWVGFNKGGKVGAGIEGSGIADTSAFANQAAAAANDIKTLRGVLDATEGNLTKLRGSISAGEADLIAWTQQLTELNSQAKAGVDVQSKINDVTAKLAKREEEVLGLYDQREKFIDQQNGATEDLIRAEERKAAAIAGGKEAKAGAKGAQRSGAGKDLVSSMQKNMTNPMANRGTQSPKADKEAAEAAEKKAKADEKASQAAQKYALVTTGLMTAMNYLKPTIDENSSALEKGFSYAVDGLNIMVGTVGSVATALAAFGIQLNKESMMSAARTAKEGLTGLIDGSLGDVLGEKISGKLQGSKLGRGASQKIVGGTGRALSGVGSGLSKVGSGLAGRGGMIGRAGSFLASAGTTVAGAGSATTAAGSTAATATTALGTAAGTAAVAVASVAAIAGTASVAVYGLGKAMDYASGVSGEYNKQVEEGNVKKAAEAKLQEKNQAALTKLAAGTTAAGAVIGGVLGSVIPGLGTALGAALGALVGAVVGLIPKLITLGPKLMKALVNMVVKGFKGLVNFLGKIPILGSVVKGVVKAFQFAGSVIMKLASPFMWLGNKLYEIGNFFAGLRDKALGFVDGFVEGIPLVGSVYKGIKSFGGGVKKLFTNFRDSIGGTLLGMDSSALVLSQAEAQAAMDKYTNNTEKNAKAQQDLLANIASGDSEKSFNEAFKSGDITKNFSNALKANVEASEASTDTLTADRISRANQIFDAEQFKEVDQKALRRGTVDGQKETDEQFKKRLVEEEGLREEQADAQVKSSKALEDEFSKSKPQFQQLAKNLTLAGGETANFEQFLGNLPEDMKGQLQAAGMTDELEKVFDQQREATLENIKYIESLNFGLRDATGAAVAMSATMDTIAASQTAGFNTFAASATTLENAMTSAGKSISASEMDSAIADLEESMRAAGVDETQIGEATGTIRGIQSAQANTDVALESAKATLLETGATDPEAIKNALLDPLLKDVQDPQTAERLKNAFSKVDFSDEGILQQIQAGDISGILSETLDPVAKAASEQANELQRKRAEAENKLIAATQDRLKAEQEFIAAQKQAIETQLEAGKLFEEFGGAKQTNDQVLGARVAQANLSLGAAGVGGLGAGNAADIRRALSDTQNKFIKQQDAANFGTLGKARGAVDAQGRAVGPAFANAAGVDEDKRQQLQDANKALVDFTRQRISLIQEELKIAQQKNAAEKSALDSLLAGDIEGYLEQQQAAAAGAALRTGDASLASAFGAGALGAGLKTLDGQGLSGKAMERASSLALGGVGISDPRAAQVMAGTTAEEEALKAEGRELAQVLGEGAQMGADLKEMQVKAANVVIEAQKITMDREINKAANIGDPIMKARGGMIYANRGMFVPRGTDTVPAMLTPGEFVVNRAAVQKGNNLALLMAMNGGGGASSMGGAMGMSSGGLVYMKNMLDIRRSGGPTADVGSLISPFGGLLGELKEMLGRADQRVYASAGSSIIGQDNMSSLMSAQENVLEGMAGVFKGPGEDMVNGLKEMFENSLGGKVFGMFEETVGKLMDFQLSVKVDPTNVNVNFNGANFLEGLRDDIKKELIAKVREELSQGKFNESGQFQSKPGGLS